MSPNFSRGFAAIHRNKTRFISPQTLETAIADTTRRQHDAQGDSAIRTACLFARDW